MTPPPFESLRSDPIPTDRDNAESKQVATTSATNSPSSPSTPNTPELHNSHPPALEVDPVIVPAMHNNNDSQRELESTEFPNPYDDLPLVTFQPSAHARPCSALDLGGYEDHLSQQSQRRPSILRPAHPKSFNSVGSQRASLTLSGFEFGLSPPSSEDLRLGIPSPSEVVRDGRQSIMQWQPHPSPSPPITHDVNGIEEEPDVEPHIEVSERREDVAHELEITGVPDEPHNEEQLDMLPTTEKTYDPWFVAANDPSSIKSSRWKFWSRSGRKAPKA